MFSKTSRYQELPNVATTDARGRRLESKSLRLLPEVPGTFLHTVEEGDRLDHLAYKYYDQPGKWWQICDANPGFMSPQALLGKEPVITDRFPLIFNGDGGPPWFCLLRDLSEKLGVENVKVVEDIHYVAEEQTHDDQKVTVYTEHYERAVIITYTRMNVRSEDLVTCIEDSGFEVGQPENIGRVGKKIIIPPDTVE